MKHFQKIYVIAIALITAIPVNTLYAAPQNTNPPSAAQQTSQSPSAVAQRLITSIEQDGVFKDVLKTSQQQQLIEVLHRVVERAPRDGDGCDSNGCGTGFAGPCGNSASSDLQVIEQTLCCIKNIIGTPCGSCCVGDACADLQTLFGFLGCLCSKIDVISSKIDTLGSCSGIDVLESKLDLCCGQVNSKLDILLAPCIPDCCIYNANDIKFILQAVTPDLIVLSADWSFDSKYLVVGYQSNGSSSQTRIQVFRYNNGVLTSVATYSDIVNANVNAVRFSPINYQIMVARDAASVTGAGTLQTYIFDPLTSSVIQQGTGISHSVANFVAVSWHPSGEYIIDTYNSPSTGTLTLSVIELYAVNTVNGGLSFLNNLTVTLTYPGAIAAQQALEWNAVNPLFAALGTRQTIGSGTPDLFIIQFDNAASPSDFAIAISINAFTAATNSNATLSIAWHPLGTLLAAGAATTVSNSHVQIFSFNAGSLTLSQVTSIPLANESRGIDALSWSPITGTILSYGTDISEGNSFLVNYCFSNTAQTLSFLSELDSGLAQPLAVTSWSPDETTIVTGGAFVPGFGMLNFYNFDRPSCSELALRLLCKENSKLDVIDSTVDIIDSKLDLCCKQLNSKINIVDSTVDIIDSKLDVCCSKVNSKLDILLAPCVTDCCVLNANDITFQTDFVADNSVNSVSWSFDSQYVVVGYASAGAASQPRIQVFKYNGSALTSLATYSDTIDANTNSVRFSPINYQIMVARAQGGSAAGTLQTYIFDPVASTLAQQGTGQSQANADYVATSWHPNGNYVIAAYNSPAGGGYTASTVALYGVNTSNGDIANASSFVTLTSSFSGAIAATQALDWNRANPLFAAVGTQQGTAGYDLFVLRFDSATTPASIEIISAKGAFNISAPSGDATLSVAWHPSGMWLAVGGSCDVIGDRVIVFAFDASAPSFSQVASVPLANEGRAIDALSWSSITGNILSYVTNDGCDMATVSSFVNYCFNNGPQTLSFLSEFFSDGATIINDVSWSPNEASIAFGDDNDTLSLYNFDRPSCSELALRLLCKENTKLDVIDSTVDIIDSKLDLCCSQLNSKLDILLAPCITDCCVLNANDIEFVTQFVTNTGVQQVILSVDWSFDSQYVVVGYTSAGAASQPRVQVFKYNGATLTPVATYSDTIDANINSVRFSPINYQIIAARAQGNSPSTEGTLQTYLFDPVGLTLTQQGTPGTFTGGDFVSVTWHPNGNFVLAAIDSPATGLAEGPYTTTDIILYSIVPSGVSAGTLTLVQDLTLTDPVTGVPGAIAAFQAIDWNAANPLFAAVGTQQTVGSGNPDLFVLQFDSATIPSTISVLLSTDAFDTSSTPDATLSVDWHPSGTLLAAGGAALVTEDHVQIYAFDGVAQTLTEVASIPLAIEPHGVTELDWSPKIANILSYVTNPEESGDSFLINYCFNTDSQTLSFLSAFDSGFITPLNAVRWSPNEASIATGGEDDSGNGVLALYNFDRPSCSELAVRLLCKENSKIDLCCSQLNSKLDILLAPCVTDCCALNANDITLQIDDLGTSNSISSLSWSFDSQYLVVGYASAGSASQPRIQVFKYNGSTLTSIAISSDTINTDIKSVRFSPLNYQIMVARGTTLQTYIFDPVDNSIVAQSFIIGLSGDCVAITWHPNGSYVLAASDSPSGGAYTTTDIILYSVVPSGAGAGTLTELNDLTLTDPVTGYPGAIAAIQALDWNTANPFYAALGTQQGSSEEADLFVLEFDDPNNPSTVSVAIAQDAFDISAPPGQATLSVAWHPSGTFLAAGGGSAATNDHVLIYAFDSIAVTLTEVTSVPLSTEPRGIDALSWSSITGNILSYGTNTQNNLGASVDSALVNYCFNNSPQTLSFLSEFTFANPINCVNWSPNEASVAINSAVFAISIYNFDRPSCSELTLRLLCKENSKLDVLDSTLDIIESKLDACCAQLNSKIDHIGGGGSSSGIDVLESKLDVCCGQVNSKLDILLAPCIPDCCIYNANDIKFILQAVTPNLIVLSADWSFDSKYLVVGYQSNGTDLQSRIQVFEYHDSTLTLFADYSDTADSDVNSVRFSPINYQIMAARADSGTADGTLQTYIFDPLTASVTQQGTGLSNTGVNYVSAAWHPNGNYIIDGSIQPPGSVSFVDLYSVNTSTGDLSFLSEVSFTIHHPGALTARQALEWNAVNTLFAAVGTQQTVGSGNPDLFIIQFDDPNNPTNITGIAFALNAFTSSSTPDATLSIDWHPSGAFLAAGAAATVTNDHVQIFSFNDVTVTLSQVTSIPLANESRGIDALSWSPITGTILSYGTDNSEGNSFLVNYCFNNAAQTLSFLSEFNSGSAQPLTVTSWSPNETTIVTGGALVLSNGILNFYSFDPPSCSELALRLLCKESSKLDVLDSTVDVIESKLDACCTQVNSKLDVIESLLRSLLP